MFYNTKEEFKADQLFEENEIIKIRQNSFEQILEKLETYNLSDTQDDVKGIAFEQFLGTTFRGELGQYFTPRTIVDFMTHILDPKENETVCDPTCGSGGFLIKAFEYMREKIEEDVKKAKSELRSVIEGENYDSLSEKEQVVINERIEAMQSTLNKELDTQVEGSRIEIGFAVDNTLSVHIVEKPFLRLVGQGVGQQIFVLHQNFHLLLHRLVFFCTACLRINISVVKFFYKPWHK